MKCFSKDALPSNYFYYLCSKFCFIFYPIYSWHNKKQRTRVDVLLFASWHILKSIICSSSVSKNSMQTNKIMAINTEFSLVHNWKCIISCFGTKWVFSCEKSQDVSHYNFFNVIKFLYLWHTFVSFINTKSRAELERELQ